MKTAKSLGKTSLSEFWREQVELHGVMFQPILDHAIKLESKPIEDLTQLEKEDLELAPTSPQF